MEKIFALVRMKLKPGMADEFRKQGLACIAAASKDLTGTTAYEWFVSPDGSEGIVIESYDDAEAIALHSRMVGGAVVAVKELAQFDLLFAGDVPEAILARMRERLGSVDYFGPRFQGRLTRRAAGAVGPKAGTMVFATARFSIQPGKQDEFHALAREAFARVEANEPGTLGYEWFINADGTECMTIDVYQDTAALLAHMANAGPVMAKILQIVKSDTTVYGALAPEVRARFKPELGVKFGGEQLGGVM